MNEVQGKDLYHKAPGVHPGTVAGHRIWLRRLIWGILISILVALIAWVVFRPHGAAQSPMGRGRFNSGPMPVVAVPAEKGDVDVVLSALGTVTPLATVTVKTQIAGQLTEVAFKEGQMVKAGDFLAQIDPRPYQQALAQYEGQLRRDQALLRTAEVDLARYKTLVAQDSIARQTLDTQESLVEQYRGTVETDKAQVDNAKLNLVYCHITAPVGGRLGLRQVDPGNYVQTSDSSGIVVITQLQPITVVFTLPEDNLPTLLKRLHAGVSLPVSVFDRAQTVQLATGRLLTLDNQIDTTTGTVKLKAQFDNADGMLFPNQFVNARLLVDTLKGATVIPNSAILRGAPGTYVYLVKADNKVTVRPVTLGPSSAERTAVLSGLEPGDEVVVDGGDKLREGAEITLPGAASKDQADQPAAPDGQRKGDGEHHRRKDQ